ALATAGVCVLGYMNHVLGERQILRNQVLALETLTRRAMIDESASVEQLLNEFLSSCRRLILFNRARVWIYNDAEMLLEKICELSPDFLPAKTVQVASAQRAVRRLGEELVGRVAERAAPLIVRDARWDARHPFFRLSTEEKARLGPVSLLELPLVACGDVVGVVEFERNAWAAYTSSDRLRVHSLATLVAMSVANIEQHRSMCRQAITDGLTGLYNKRHILQTLADEVRRAERYRHPLSVMMLDLDGFKAYNDNYGHLQGDVLLQQLSHLIQRNIRSADSAGRYGGEEFILVMPETEKAAAVVIAERIRSQVDTARFPGDSYSASSPNAIPNFVNLDAVASGSDEGYAHKTISIGVATYPHDTDDIQRLLALADDALYQAKRSGRNRVAVASPIAPAPAR
ncbi:MAG TPA: sensor domain-containing diguanylate cyclase, partial [Capsulimonadaceae bacterium]|nr:sensor domain-containing diguanylate cyclase [Capsulimonadaceae bacterium]